MLARRVGRRVSRGSELRPPVWKWEECFLKRQPPCLLLFVGRRAGWLQLSPSSRLPSSTAMISQFFILSSKGDPLIYKDCILGQRNGAE